MNIFTKYTRNVTNYKNKKLLYYVHFLRKSIQKKNSFLYIKKLSRVWCRVNYSEMIPIFYAYLRDNLYINDI